VVGKGMVARRTTLCLSIPRHSTAGWFIELVTGDANQIAGCVVAFVAFVVYMYFRLVQKWMDGLQNHVDFLQESAMETAIELEVLRQELQSLQRS
jgi:hypothetical protein